MKTGVVCLLLLASLPAWAEVPGEVAAMQSPGADVEAPLIAHTPISTAPRESELVVKARISDVSGVFAATASFRPADSGEAWQTVDLKPVDGQPDLFSGAIAGSQVLGDLEYFIEAFDTHGNGPASVGSAAAPLRVLATEKLPDAVLVVEKSLPVGPIAVAGGGVLMTAVGAALWFTAAGRVEEIDAKYPTTGQGRLPADVEATQGAIGRSRIGSALMLAGGAAIVGGVAWFLVPTTDGGAQLGVSGDF